MNKVKNFTFMVDNHLDENGRQTRPTTISWYVEFENGTFLQGG